MFFIMFTAILLLLLLNLLTITYTKETNHIQCNNLLTTGVEFARNGTITIAQRNLDTYNEKCEPSRLASETISALQQGWAYIFWRSLRRGDLPQLNYTRGGDSTEDALSYFRYPRRERFRNRYISERTAIYALESDFEGLREVRRAVHSENSGEIYRDALNYFQDALTADPYNPVYVYHIALCFQRLHEFQMSQRMYRRLFDLEPYPDIYWLDTYHRLNDALKVQDERSRFAQYSKPIVDVSLATRESSSPPPPPPPKIVFAGIVRDAAEHLNNMIIPLLENTTQRLGSNNHLILIFENDSIDGTDRVLSDFARRNSRVRILSSSSSSDNNEFTPSPTSHFGIWDKQRFDAMAKARNVYLQEIRESYSDYDYLVVVDMHATTSWNLEAFLRSVTSSSSSWDVQCANGKYLQNNKYYDGLAYRPLGFQGTLGEWLKMMNVVLSASFDTESKKMFRVQSCFGGMAIYKIQTLLRANECTYFGHETSDDCEHVRLHKCLEARAGANIVVNPALDLYR